MGKKLPPDQLALYKRIDEILWRDWDPIGISDIPEATDEYQGYLPGIFALALNRCDLEEIASRLNWIARERMGLRGNLDDSMWVAKRICEARDQLIGHGDEA